MFYGASCTGPVGDWFLNATQGGTKSDESFHLRWVFRSQPSVAMPSGTAKALGSAGQKISIAIVSGRVTISGTTAGGKPLRAAGRLSVQITGSASAPTLTITETGLAAVDDQLGLKSPFDLAGRPVTLPVKVVHRLAGCSSK